MKNINSNKMVWAMIFVIAGLNININAQTLTGRQIMQNVKDRPDGESRYSEMKMELINKRNKKRVREVKSYSIDIGEDKKTIMFFLYPGDVKGTGFLTWDYDEIGKDDDKWLYLPAMKKTRRISGSSAKKDYFMGTDFTYDDMGSRNVDEDDHKLLREEEFEGHNCWVIESVSKDKQSLFSKKISWIRKDCLVALKVEYYDKLNKLHRELILSDIKKVDGFWQANKLHMTNVQDNHQTIITLSNSRFNVDVNEEQFTVSNLERGDI